jgi:hypothetical protein
VKPHPRIRTTVKWGGAAVTVLLAGVWVGSGWQSYLWIDMNSPMHGYALESGSLSVLGPNRAFVHSQYRGWVAHRHVFVMNWRVGTRMVSSWEAWSIPLWIFVLPVAVASGAAWHLDTRARRRAKLDLCPKCGYNRTGLTPGAVCPECGTASVAD